MPLPGVKGSRYGVSPPSGIQGVMGGDCPPESPYSPPGTMVIMGRAVETSMPSLHFSASSSRSKAPVPPLGS